jgi:pyruvate kinase
MYLPASEIQQQLEKLNVLLLDTEKEHGSLIKKLHLSQQLSAVNLLHYLALRSVDIRDLQDALHQQGLSSLTNSESHIHGQLLAILQHYNYQGPPAICTYNNCKTLLKQKTNALFGNVYKEGDPCIMVTFKTSYAHDSLAVKKLLKAGMNIARINCAHDDEETWMNMVKQVRKATEITGIPCKIYMDLAGPKIRTRISGKKNRIKVEEEDQLLLSDNENYHDRLPVVGCTIPGIASQLKPGEKVFFDDGLIEARVTGLRPEAAELRIVRASGKKPYLKAEKGINFPDSNLALSALTDFDRKCLPFMLEHADMIGYSFLHNVPDLDELQKEMKEKKLPIILKIEKPEAFKNFPDLLFKAMEEECFGVMVARGDLAVEIGFERMSEVQEEICWISEAAHAPVIWATQVLDNMNKLGIATRAEITDASYGTMAECVMINKGPHTVQVIKSLKNILQRSGGHHLKKRFLFRPLSIAKEFLNKTKRSLPLTT